ncbi:MAG: hypothetical protein LZF61_01490 [Nitrosomonas sp.]|nr:MAG: hypothetical protein LZF61_01490 [Nitrosomonas sp.]
MKAELKSLEDNVSLLIELYQDSRLENNQLREELATSHAQCEALHEKINIAASRLETLILELPNNE